MCFLCAGFCGGWRVHIGTTQPLAREIRKFGNLGNSEMATAAAAHAGRLLSSSVRSSCAWNQELEIMGVPCAGFCGAGGCTFAGLCTAELQAAASSGKQLLALARAMNWLNAGALRSEVV